MSKKKVVFFDEEQSAVTALRKSELRYRRLFESAQDGILILDGNTVEAHGGSISAFSAGLNLGSSFTLQFRCADAEAANPLTETAELIGPLTILLVEAHKDSRECMRKLLQMRGHEVIDAENGQEALRFGRSCTFDLLITDISLPDLDGLVLLKKLRESRPELEGIALSGYAMPLDVVKSKEAGYLEHLSKSVSLVQLDEAIRQVVVHQTRTQ